MKAERQKMRVLVTGAAGHLGRPLVRQLVSAGHQVAGTTRTPRKQSLLKQLGADPIVIDALDRAQVQRAISGWGPEAIVHALTAIPAAGPLPHADLEMTDVYDVQGHSTWSTPPATTAFDALSQSPWSSPAA